MKRGSGLLLLALGGAMSAACSGAAPEAEPGGAATAAQTPIAFDMGAPASAALGDPGPRAAPSLPANLAHRAGWSMGFGRGRSGAQLSAPSPSLSPLPQRTLRVLVVPALFSDSAAPSSSPEDIADAMFGAVSLARFFEQQSGGGFSLDGVVTKWLRSSTSLSDAVGTEYGLGSDARLGEHLGDVIAQAATQVHLPDFDNDGPDGVANSGDDDGQADLVVVLFSELGAPCGGVGPWGHRATLSYWSGAPLVTSAIGKNGAAISAEDYVLAGATSCGTSPRDAIVVLAHELGHALGLPDLYETSLGYQPGERKWILGCWGLMAGGPWQCPNADGLPAPLSAWSRDQLGWLRVERRPLRDQELAFGSDLAFVLPLANGQELWVERRHWDAAPGWSPGSGALVYRVPTAAGTSGRPAEVFEVDGDQALSKPEIADGDRGRAGDVLMAGSKLSLGTFSLSGAADRDEKSIVRVHMQP